MVECRALTFGAPLAIAQRTDDELLRRRAPSLVSPLYTAPFNMRTSAGERLKVKTRGDVAVQSATSSYDASSAPQLNAEESNVSLALVDIGTIHGSKSRSGEVWSTPPNTYLVSAKRHDSSNVHTAFLRRHHHTGRKDVKRLGGNPRLRTLSNASYKWTMPEDGSLGFATLPRNDAISKSQRKHATTHRTSETKYRVARRLISRVPWKSHATLFKATVFIFLAAALGRLIGVNSLQSFVMAVVP